MHRRDAIKMGLLGAATFSTRAFGQAAATDRVLPGDGSVANDPKETIELWPATPPGGAGLSLVNRVTDRSPDPQRPDRFVDHIGKPGLTVFRPARPDGSAVILVVRAQTLLPPRPELTVEPGDQVYVVSQPEDRGVIQLLFGRPDQD